MREIPTPPSKLLLKPFSLNDPRFTVSDPTGVVSSIDDGPNGLNTINLTGVSGSVTWKMPLSDIIGELDPLDTVRLLGKIFVNAGGWTGADYLQIGLEDSASGVFYSGGPRPTNAVGVETNLAPYATNGIAGCLGAFVQVDNYTRSRLYPVVAHGIDNTGWLGQRISTVSAAANCDTLRCSLFRAGAAVASVETFWSTSLTRVPFNPEAGRKIPSAGGL